MKAAALAIAVAWTCPAITQAADEVRVLDTVTAERVESRPPLHSVPRWVVPGRPTIALALSGGGARGIAHLGVLQAMYRDGVEFDAIAGTSFGALIGAFVSTGYWPDEVEQILAGRSWNDILFGTDARNRVLSREEDLVRASPPLRLRFRGHRSFQIGALVDSRPFERELYRFLLPGQLASGGEFDDLRYRFRPVATDILSGAAVVPERGNLVAAVRGSSAVPGVFRPVRFGDALLVDGGLVANVPVDTARAFGADLVVAVDISEGIIGDRAVRGAFDLLNRSVNVLITAQTEQLLELTDLVLAPEVGGFPPSDFAAHVGGLVQAGVDAYAQVRDRLWTVLESRSPDRRRLTYDAIEVVGTQWVDAATLATRLGGPAGAVSRFRVASELARALNLGPLSTGRVEYTQHPDARRVLRFHFEEHPEIRGIAIDGAPLDALGDFDLTAIVGRRFSLDEARILVWQARQRLIEAGSVFVALEELTWDPLAGRLVARVSDAPVGRVTVTGDSELRAHRLRRFLRDFEGQRLRYDRLTDRMDELVARGVIGGWRITPRAREDGVVDLEVGVEGARFYEVSASVDYRDALGWAGYLRGAKVNLTGHGDFVDLVLAKSVDREYAQLRYGTEYFFGFANLGAEIGVRGFDNGFQFVDAEQKLREALEQRYHGWRAWLALSRRLRWGAVLRAGLFREQNELDAVAATMLPGETRTRSSWFVDLELDRTDRLLFPTRGSWLKIEGEQSVSGQDLWRHELRSGGLLSIGARSRHTLGGLFALGLSDGADRRPFWFDPGGHRELYGFIPFGAAAPQYARAGARWRFQALDWRGLRVYVEGGVDAVRTAIIRQDLLDQAETVFGYGGSVTGHTDFIGPITIGVARNSNEATTAFVTLGYGLFD